LKIFFSFLLIIYAKIIKKNLINFKIYINNDLYKMEKKKFFFKSKKKKIKKGFINFKKKAKKKLIIFFLIFFLNFSIEKIENF
jgi:hypothetical protein